MKLIPILAMTVSLLSAGVVDPECTPQKALKGAATKAVVGVKTTRCTGKEAAKDTLGIDKKKGDKKESSPVKIPTH